MSAAAASDPGAAPRRILVIKHGALGDFVQALGAMMAIRAYHLADRVTLLTTAPLVEMARASGWFDEVWVDDRPGPLAVAAWLALIRRLRGARFDRVYDLQNSQRSALYFRLLGPGPRPEWSGIAKGCSHPHDNPDRDRLHSVDRLADQLAVAGLGHVPPPLIDWLQGEVARFPVRGRFALLVPGGAAHRPAKRWPAEHYAKLAWRLRQAGLQPVLLGGETERKLTAAIAEACPEALDLAGETSLADIASLARRASVAVGNDTGPMQLIAVAGCPSVVLFSAASEPALCAPRGERVTILRRQPLAELGVDEVAAAALGDREPA